jgi:hypothetical protein
MNNEVWKQHEEYPHVEFSNLGNARKLRKNGEYKLLHKTHSKRQPYHQINAQAGVRLYVHRETCKLFNPNPHPEQYTHVLHNNHDRYDNRAKNLRWGTQKQNMQDRFEAGHYLKGFGHCNAKLTPANVFEILFMRAYTNVTQRELAPYYGIHQSTISYITTGRTWGHTSQNKRIAE